MLNIIKGKFFAFAVFEPFLSWLVATDIKIPSNFWHTIKILSIIDIYFTIIKG